MNDTPAEIAEKIIDGIVKCNRCRGRLTIRVKHATIYSTDSDDEIEAAYHDERCPECQSRIIAILSRQSQCIRDESEMIDLHYVFLNKKRIRELEQQIHSNREVIAEFMHSLSIATGHGDTSQDLLRELGAYIGELRELKISLEQQVATLTSSGLVKCPLCGGPNSPADGGTRRCFHCECGYLQCGAGYTTLMKQVSQSNKELLDVLQKLADKIDLMEKPINNCIAISIIHGIPYSGPNWAQELTAARAAITKHGGR